MQLPKIFHFNKTGKYLANTPIKKKIGAPIKDDFSKIPTTKDFYLEKLYKLFPNKSLKKAYYQINKDFSIDYPPKLLFFVSENEVMKSGYNFKDNSINLNLRELLDKNHKIIRKTKDGEETLISNVTKFPIFLTKEEAQNYINLNLGKNTYSTKPITPKEQRKFILQKITHEIIKAQQCMLIRQVDKIGDVGIIQAGIQSKTIQKAKQKEACARYLLGNTFWNKHKTTQEISLDTPIGRQALIWLDSIENPHPLSSIERDAHQRSYNYILAKFGNY